jgi:hypothetical protein
VSRVVIDAIRGGTALFAYYPDERWLSSSSFLRCEPEPEALEAPTPLAAAALGSWSRALPGR